MNGERRVSVLVCGEPLRGDDAVGQAVVAALPGGTRALGDVRHVRGLMPDDLITGGAPVVIVDAVLGLPPGTVVDLPLDELAALTGAGAAPGSTHALPLPVVLGIVERLSGALPEGRFIGVAAESDALGSPLSPPVRDAIGPCATRLGHWIRALAGPEGTAPCA